MRLEPRRVLNASAIVPLVDVTADDGGDVTFDGRGGVTIGAGVFADDGQADVFRVSRHGEQITVSLAGNVLFSGLSGDITSLTIRGSSDADHLAVNLGGDGPIGALRFDAGDSDANDTISLTGAASRVGHVWDGTGDGNVAAAGTQIHYNDVEVLRDVVTTAHRSLDLGGIDTATLSPTAELLRLDADGHRLVFAESSRLSIDLVDGTANRFDVNGLGNETVDVSIAGEHDDVVRLSGRSDLGDGDLTVSAGTIDIDGDVRSDGGDLRFHAVKELRVDADARLDSDGGLIELHAGRHGDLDVAGRVDASDDNGTGGDVHLLGRNVHLASSAVIDADGRFGGGTILAGGDYQGANDDVLNALRTTIEQGAVLTASADVAGDGGRIIVWADGATHFAGAVLARGGDRSGDGGFVEVSGKQALAFLGTADLAAPHGRGGTLLLDPRTITIVEPPASPDLNGDGTTGDDLADAGDLDDATKFGNVDSVISASAIVTLLENGQTVILAATDLIQVDAAIAVGTGNAALTFEADVVAINADITIGGNLIVRADALQLDGNVTTTETVVFTTLQSGTLIDLGGADVLDGTETLGLTNDELQRVSAAVLHIGSAAAGSISLTADITSPTALLRLVSAGSITGPAGPGAAGITATTLVITAGDGVDLRGDHAVGTIRGTIDGATGDFVFIDRDGDLTVGTIATGGGDVSLTTVGTLNISTAIELENGDASLLLAGDVVSITTNISVPGSITVRADALTIGNGVTVATPGTVVLTTFQAATTIDLGGNDVPQGGNETLGLTNAELQRVSAALLQIGSTTAGNIQLTESVTSPADVLRLVTSGTITSTGPSSAAGPGITADAMLVTAASVSLLGNNQVGSVAGTIIGGTGEFRLANRAGNLEIGTVDGVNGITTAGGDVVIGVGGVLTISSDILTNGGDVRLTATNGAQIAGGEINAGSGVITVTNGVLRGTGTMTGNVVVASGATLSPGTAATAGVLTINGDLTFEAGSTYYASIHDNRTNPPDAPVAGDDYDQIVVSGNVSIQTTGPGATLTIDVATGSQIDAGDGYQLIDAAGTVTGEFDNHPEAEIIEEFGGSTHDVALTYAAGGLLVQVVGPLVFAPPPDSSATNIRIVRNGAYVEFRVNGSLVSSNLLVAATGITVVGADGEDDTLTVDFSGGGFGRSIEFDGGTGGNDALILTGGGTFDTVTHNFTNASSGSIELDSATVDDVITYSGLEPIDDNLSATNRVFQFNGGSETITLVDAAAAGEMMIDSTHGESVTFVNPTASLTINAGSGDDTFNINSVDAGFVAALSILGGPQGDVVTVSAALALGDGSVTGNLAVMAESIIIAANLSTDGGTNAGNITLTGNVVLTVDIAIDTNVAGGGDDGTFTLTGTLDADTSGLDLTVDAGNGNISFGGSVGAAEQFDNLTIIAAADVEFDGAVHLTGDLSQTAGTGTTTLHGGTVGGSLNLTTDRVAFAAGTLDVTGDANVSASSGIAGGTADGVADLSAASIVLNVTGAGNDGIGTVGTPLEVATPGAIDINTSAGNGDVFLHTIGDLRIGRINAGGGDATLSTTGSIIDALVGDGVGNENLVASTATLAAVTGVGSTDAIDTNVGFLGVINTTSGGITIAEVDSITVTALVQQGNPADGSILLSAGGTITVDGNMSTGATSSVRLVAGNAIGQTSGAITGGSLGATALNNINLLGAANDVDVFAGRSAEGSLAFADADGFTLGSVAADGVFTGASGADATGGNVTLRTVAGPLVLDANVTAGGAVRLNSGAGVTQQSGTITGASLGVIAANHVTLDAATNDVNVFAVDAGGDVVFVDTNGVTIGAVVAAAGFAGGATGVTGGAITLRMETGNLQINEGINASGAVRLSAENGFVRQAGDAGIIATSLGVRAGTAAIDLASASNDVDVFAAASGGEIVYRDATGFTVGSVAGTSLFTATTGAVVVGVGEFLLTDITLVAVAGPLTLDADVSTNPLGTVRLVSGAGIAQTGGEITARDLGVIAAGNVSLLSAGNSVETFAAETVGDVFYRNTGSLTIGGVAANDLFGGAGGVSTGDGDVLLVSNNGSLLIFDTIDAGTGTVRLSAAGWIEQDDAVVLAGSLGARAGVAVVLLEAGNNVDTFAAFAGEGIVSYQDADDLTIGNVAAFGTPGLFAATSGIVALDNGEAVEVLLVTGQGGAAGNGDLVIQSQISALGGTVLINADGNVTQQTGPIRTGELGVYVTNGSVQLFGNNDVGVFAAETDGGSIGFADVDDVIVGTVIGFNESYFPGVTGVASNGGDIVIVAGSLTVAEAVQSSGGTILLQADAMNLQAAVDATAAGIVQVTVRTNGTGITLGGGGGLSLTDAELNQITAHHLAIGGVAVDATGNGPTVSAGRITIAAGISFGNVTNLSFLTGADVYGAVADAITIGGAIVLDVGTGVSGVGGSDGTYLAVDTGAGVAGRVRGTGEFRVSSFGDTTVGLAAAIDPIAVAGLFASGLTSVSTANGTIALEALFGSLTVDGDLAVQGANADLVLQAIGFPLFAIEGNVFLNATISSDRDILLGATDDIVQADGNLIDAAGVRLTAGGQIGTAADAIDLNADRVSAVTTGGNISLNEVAAGGRLAIGLVGGQSGISASGVVSVTTEAGNLVVNQSVAAGGTVTLDSSDGLTSAATGTISGQTLTLLAVSDVSLEGTLNSVGSTTITSSTGGVRFAGANVGGLLDVDANGGSIEVTGEADADGLVDFDAVGAIRVLNGGSLAGNVINLDAGMGIQIGGVVHSNTVLQAVAGGNVAISATVSAGGLLSIDAAGTIGSTPAGALTANVVDLQAGSSITLNGSLASNGQATVHSLDGDVSIADATVGGLFDVDADSGNIAVDGTVFGSGMVDFDAAGTILLANTGSLRGAAVDLRAGGAIRLFGDSMAIGPFTAVASAGMVVLNGPLDAGGSVTVRAIENSVSIGGRVLAAGAVDVDAASRIDVDAGGVLRGSQVDLLAGSSIGLNGNVIAAAGMLTATAATGSIAVSSKLVAAGMLDLNAAQGNIIVSGSGRLDAGRIDIDAGGQVDLNGRTTANLDVVVNSGQATTIGGRMDAGGLVSLRSSALTVSVGGTIAGSVVDAAATGAIRLAGPVASVLGTSIISTGAGVEIDAAMMSNRGISIVANGGHVTLDATLTAGTHASIAAARNLVVGSGSVRADDVQMLAGGAASIGGSIVARHDASIVSVGGGLTTSATVAAGRNASMVAGNGHLLLGGNVQAGMSASLRSPHGSILQPSAVTTVTAVAAQFAAGGSVGRAGGAIDLDVGQVAATASGGGAWLHQQASGGTLTVAVLGAERGVRSVGQTSISTSNGDLRLAAPVMGTTIDLVADRVAGSAQRGRVMFEGGYAETPTGRIVATPPRNIPVDANGDPITRFDLASPFVVSFGILAGNTADTVDGRLSDFGTTVTVDFVQPELFDPTQRQIQSLTDRGSDFVNGIFAPFRFQYNELFLQERLILSGAREQLFDITITATQDDSISIAEKLAGVTIVDATKQTVTFGNVSTSPTEQSLTVPLGIVSPVVASIEVPAPPPEEPQPPPSTPTAYVAAPAALVVERAGAETSGASAGATSTDRPRLFLVWMRPGQDGPPATIEIDLIWFAREYQRQLIGHLKEGRYWFELAEPGSPARQLGDSFYVRNGLVVDDPSAGDQPDVAAESLVVPPPSDEGLTPVDAPRPAVTPNQPAAADESPAALASPAAAAAMGAVTVLGSRWRRRLIAAGEHEERPAPLGRLARFSRQIRRVAAVPVDEHFAGGPAIADETAEANGRW